MLNLLMKVIICPIIVVLASAVLPSVDLYFYQAVVIGIILAVAGHLLEWALLEKGTFWISNIIDFVSSALIIFFSSYFFEDARITFVGVLLTAGMLTVVEYFVHMWLIRSGRARKEPTL